MIGRWSLLIPVGLPAALAALGVLAGCRFSPDGPASATDGGGLDAGCVPGCSDDSSALVACGPGGEPMTQPCGFGCVGDDGAAACAVDLIPSNVEVGQLTTFQLGEVSGGIPSELGFRIAIDADLGVIYKYPAVGPFIGIRPGLSGISNGMGFEQLSSTLSVLAVSELRLVNGSTLEVFGTRALVILAVNDVNIDGVVRADAGLCDQAVKRASCNGAGGGRGGGEMGANATGCAAGGNGSNGLRDTGGGGGGMATPGGNGGTSGAAAGGVAVVDPSACAGPALVPLGGGGGGGQAGGAGGGGGGGLQITAFGALRIGSAATLTAVGAGGQGTTMLDNGGGGGGAGGGLLLEAPTVDVALGAVSVAGGGGGGGRFVMRDGEAGRSDGQPALGGQGDLIVPTDGLGGNGAVTAIGALAGSSNAAGDLDGTGGGGGGLGRIRVNSVRGEATAGARFVGRFSAGRTGRRAP